MAAMRALILNGSPKGDLLTEKISAVILEKLKELDFSGHLLNLAEIEITPCIGCFGCWIKTPGLCVINDAGRDIAREFVNSQITIFITPITFGGYSHNSKKVIDRLIPILSPYFRRVSGEVHHKMRYNRYPSSLTIGILRKPDQDKEILFKTLVRRNSLNYESPSWNVGVLYESCSDKEIREKIKKLLLQIVENDMMKVGVCR